MCELFYDTLDTDVKDTQKANAPSRTVGFYTQQ
jgi:hypothetical protein